jgi:Cu-processing system permease protein
LITRVLAVALNAYREAVRARVLHALFGLALAVTAYSLVLGTLSLHQDARVVADVGTASASLFGIVLAVTLAATMLHREVELKTLYPILTRRLLRHEYVLGKFLGIHLTVAAFLVTDAGLTLTLLATRLDRPVWTIVLAGVGLFAVFGAAAAWRPLRTYALVPAALAFLALAAYAAGGANGERQLVLAQLVLSLGETAVVLGVTMLFASFSSPFLTAAGALGVFVVGRSADTLANLPARLFGEGVRTMGGVLAKIVPNLQIFVPERPLLLGHANASTWAYVARSSGMAAAYALVLLGLAAVVFSRRDFE